MFSYVHPVFHSATSNSSTSSSRASGLTRQKSGKHRGAGMLDEDVMAAGAVWADNHHQSTTYHMVPNEQGENNTNMRIKAGESSINI